MIIDYILFLASFFKVIFSFTFILLFPGWALMFFLFPPQALVWQFRLGGSVLASIAMSSLTGTILLLNMLKPDSFIFGVFISSISFIFILLGVIRWWKNFDFTYLHYSQGSQSKLISITVIFILATFTFYYFNRTPPRGLTELYFINPAIGQYSELQQSPLDYSFEVKNLEGYSQEYNIKVLIDGNVFKIFDNIILDENGSWRGELLVDSNTLVGKSFLEIRLYKANEPDVYTNIRVWLNP